MVFAGIASALRRVALQRYANGYPRRNEEYCWLLGAGYVIFAIWIFFFRRDRGIVLRDLNHIPIPLIVVNIVATTTALLVDRSTIFPMDVRVSEEGRKNHKAPSLCDYDTFSLTITAGIAGCSTMVGIRRSYTSWFQYCCFAIGILCGGLQPTFAPRRTDTRRRQGDDSSTYELLEDNSSTSAEDGETDHAPNDMGTTEMSLAGTRSSWISIQSTFQIVSLFVIWSLAITMNYDNTRRTSFHASIDRNYEATMSLEIVLSMYSEPIDDAKDLISSFRSAPETGKASVTIYTKYEKADTERLKTSTGADNVIKLKNVGREGETYLHHITSRWGSLAKHTLYLQADVRFSRNFCARCKDISILIGQVSSVWAGTTSAIAKTAVTVFTGGTVPDYFQSTTPRFTTQLSAEMPYSATRARSWRQLRVRVASTKANTKNFSMPSPIRTAGCISRTFCEVDRTP